jgi:hypothetical protein
MQRVNGQSDRVHEESVMFRAMNVKSTRRTRNLLGDALHAVLIDRYESRARTIQVEDQSEAGAHNQRQYRQEPMGTDRQTGPDHEAGSDANEKQTNPGRLGDAAGASRGSSPLAASKVSSPTPSKSANGIDTPGWGLSSTGLKKGGISRRQQSLRCCSPLRPCSPQPRA